jgi:hypothetical protein
MVIPPTRRTSWPSVSGNVKISFACSSAKSVGVASGSGAGKVLRSVVSLMRLSLLISKSITYTLNPSSLAKCSPAFCVGGASGLPPTARIATDRTLPDDPAGSGVTVAFGLQDRPHAAVDLVLEVVVALGALVQRHRVGHQVGRL